MEVVNRSDQTLPLCLTAEQRTDLELSLLSL
jgi:hypothetical protein